MSKNLVWLMAVCAVHYDLNFELVLCYLAGEYTCALRDVAQIIRNVSLYVSHIPIQRIFSKSP